MFARVASFRRTTGTRSPSLAPTTFFSSLCLLFLSYFPPYMLDLLTDLVVPSSHVYKTETCLNCIVLFFPLLSV